MYLLRGAGQAAEPEEEGGRDRRKSKHFTAANVIFCAQHILKYR